MDGRPIRPLDWNHEILIDFDDGREFGLGFLTCFHDACTERILCWYIIDENGDYIDGLGPRFKSKSTATKAATKWLTDRLAA
tara:strand:- start:294 stop:539 length:246 start_codon:yes stop_codon:yes gene_type:complete